MGLGDLDSILYFNIFQFLWELWVKMQEIVELAKNDRKSNGKLKYDDRIIMSLGLCPASIVDVHCTTASKMKQEG